MAYVKKKIAHVYVSNCSACQKDNNYPLISSSIFMIKLPTTCIPLHFSFSLASLHLFSIFFFCTHPPPSKAISIFFDVSVVVDSVESSTWWRLLCPWHFESLFLMAFLLSPDTHIQPEVAYQAFPIWLSNPSTTNDQCLKRTPSYCLI